MKNGNAALSVCWRRLQSLGLDYCCLTDHEDGMVIEGVVIGEDQVRFGATYKVMTDKHLCTRLVKITLAAGPCLHLSSDGQGHWQDELTRTPLPALDGCRDVDIGMTPATNSLPIRRLGLDQGEGATMAVAYIPVPDLSASAWMPEPATQRYTRLQSQCSYRYENLSSGFDTTIDVDDEGLVLNYPGIFQRV